MKPHLRPWVMILFLVCFGLACDFLNIISFVLDPDPGPLTVDRVDVVPSEGNGRFSVSVVLFSHTREDSLLCKYNDFRGTQETVYQQTVPPGDKAVTLNFEFTLTQPGTYNLNCTPQELGLTSGTSFIVTDPLAPTLSSTPPDASTLGSEQPVQPILLGGVLFYEEVKTSGLTWYGDLLLDLPQRLDQYHAIFAIRKEEILTFLAGEYEPVGGHGFKVDLPDLSAQIPDYQGFEAIAVSGDKVYLTIEAGRGNDMQGYLVMGVIDPIADEVNLDMTRLISLPPQSQVPGMAYQALTIVDDKVLAIYAANGAGLNPSPVACLFSLDLDSLGTIPFPNIEYRVTDATPADEFGRFWVLNVYNPAEADPLPKIDPLVTEFGQGATHAQYPQVERLIQLQYSPSGVTLVNEPPIQLQLARESRRWQGLALLEDRGFLLMTDEIPSTMLGFVIKP
jgi:hypothetical protein